MAKLKIETPPWAEKFLAPSRYKGIFGGRGSGKSHFLAELLIERHILNPNTRSVCIREVQKSLQNSVKALLESKIESLGVQSLFEIQANCIRNRFGTGVIIFQGMQNHTADSIKSLEGFDIALTEEAQSLSQRSLDLLRPTIRKDGSELWFAWNPRLPTDPIDVFLRGQRPPDGSIIEHVNYDGNPWLPQVLLEELEYDRRRDPDKFSHVWLGNYLRNSETRVFKNWSIEDFETPEGVMFRFGCDFGFANDPTVLVRSYQVGRKLFIDQEAYKVGCEITETPNLFYTIAESEKWPIVADNSRPETISYLRKVGFKIHSAVKGSRSLEEGVEWLKSYDIVVHSRCRNMIDELTLYSYKTDPATNRILPVLEDKKNHLIDALRYSEEGQRRARKNKNMDNIIPIANIKRWKKA